MAAHLTSFEVGDMVDFSAYANKKYAKFAEKLQEEIGKGPYRVTEVESIFRDAPCTCGVGEVGLEDWMHSDECHARRFLINTNHHQWITLQTAQGERTFSGAYFSKIHVSVAK